MPPRGTSVTQWLPCTAVDSSEGTATVTRDDIALVLPYVGLAPVSGSTVAVFEIGGVWLVAGREIGSPE